MRRPRSRKRCRCQFAAQLRVKLHSINPLEWLNKEVKRPADAVGIFPNEDSITRLTSVVLLDQNDEYQLQKLSTPVEFRAGRAE